MAQENNNTTNSCDISVNLENLLKSFTQNKPDETDIFTKQLTNTDEDNHGQRYKSELIIDNNESHTDNIESQISSKQQKFDSIQMYNMCAIKSIVDNQVHNGQFYLLVEGNNNDSSINSTSSLEHNVQLLTQNENKLLTTISSSITNNSSTHLQSKFEFPQMSCTDNQLESILNGNKIVTPKLSSLLCKYDTTTIESDNVSDYYNDSNVSLSFIDLNQESNSQFSINNDRNIKLESHLTTIDDIINNSLTNDSLPNDFEQYNAIPNNTNRTSSFNTTTNGNITQRKTLKRIKAKPLKNMETDSYLDCAFKLYSPNSPNFMNSQMEDNSSKGSDHGDSKEPIRKLSHNEVERRRRDKINAWIGELRNMLPNSEKMLLNRSKGHTLKAVYEFFHGQTGQFSDLKLQNQKLEEENKQKTATIRKLESEKEVLLKQLQFINHAVTSTVRSTQDSLNRSTVNQYQIMPPDPVKVTQPYIIANIYANNDIKPFENGFASHDQKKKKKPN